METVRRIVIGLGALGRDLRCAVGRHDPLMWDTATPGRLALRCPHCLWMSPGVALGPAAIRSSAATSTSLSGARGARPPAVTSIRGWWAAVAPRKRVWGMTSCRSGR